MLSYLKAIVAAAVAGLGALGTALADNHLSPVEWVGVASATLLALAAVWGVPNKTTDPVDDLADRDRRLVKRADVQAQVTPKLRPSDPPPGPPQPPWPSGHNPVG